MGEASLREGARESCQQEEADPHFRENGLEKQEGADQIERVGPEACNLFQVLWNTFGRGRGQGRGGGVGC